jgi:hypothetical protein
MGLIPVNLGTANSTGHQANCRHALQLALRPLSEPLAQNRAPPHRAAPSDNLDGRYIAQKLKRHDSPYATN